MRANKTNENEKLGCLINSKPGDLIVKESLGLLSKETMSVRNKCVH